MQKLPACLVLFFVLLMSHFSFAGDSLNVIVNGMVYSSANPDARLEDLMIINLRTSQGTFGKADGSFSVTAHKTDTLLIASTGFEYARISMADSVSKPIYFARVPITKLARTLKEVNIFSPRDLQSIYTDIQKLGYNKKDFELSGVNALSSPITFLYQEFSQFQRVRRHNAERINNDKRKELLRQLLANYVEHDIVNLDDTEFDDFIDFCNVPETYMKQASQYDFCIYIKQRFDVFRMMKTDRR